MNDDAAYDDAAYDDDDIREAHVNARALAALERAIERANDERANANAHASTSHSRRGNDDRAMRKLNQRASELVRRARKGTDDALTTRAREIEDVARAMARASRECDEECDEKRGKSEENSKRDDAEARARKGEGEGGGRAVRVERERDDAKDEGKRDARRPRTTRSVLAMTEWNERKTVRNGSGDAKSARLTGKEREMLDEHVAIRDGLTEEMSALASGLKRNALALERGLARSNQVLDDVEQKLERNVLGVKASVKRQTRAYGANRRGSCWTMIILFLVGVVFAWTYVVIKFSNDKIKASRAIAKAMGKAKM